MIGIHALTQGGLCCTFCIFKDTSISLTMLSAQYSNSCVFIHFFSSHHPECFQYFEQFPQSLEKARKLVNPKYSIKFVRYVVCRKCHKIYHFHECGEYLESERLKRSKVCSFVAYPHHPHKAKRSQCGFLLLKTVELAAGKTFLYPFITYCYSGFETSLQTLLQNQAFYQAVNSGEHVR